MFTSSSSGVPSPNPEEAGSSRVRTARQPQPQAFDYFVVLDFEATCEKGAQIYPQEIIEFPSVLVDGATGNLESEFRTYVRPQHHPVLTDFCRDLTGIRQADVDSGVQLSEALRLHGAWLRASAWARNGGCFAVVTWGDWDLRTMLETECRFKGLTKPPYFNHWIDLKIPFATALGGGRRAALQWAVRVRAAGLEWEGRPHCSVDDARNTARRPAQHYELPAGPIASGNSMRWCRRSVLLLLRGGEQRWRAGGAGAYAGQMLLRLR